MRKGSRRRRLTLAGGGILALAVAAFLVVYFVLFPTSSPKPFKLTPSSESTAGTSGSSSTTGATGTSTAAGAGTSTAAGAGTSTAGTSTAAGGLAGTWKIASGSLAGYRVREKLGFLPAQSDAVGRTGQITGSATFAQSGGTLTIAKASFDIAVETLKSDRSMRDEKIHQIGLESDRYPTATFALSKPLTVQASALRDHVAHVSATGAIEIHGVTQTETLPVELTLAGSTLEAAGSLTFPWSRFGMTAPSIGGFVNVTGKATMEFDLRLQHA